MSMTRHPKQVFSVGGVHTQPGGIHGYTSWQTALLVASISEQIGRFIVTSSYFSLVYDGSLYQQLKGNCQYWSCSFKNRAHMNIARKVTKNQNITYLSFLIVFYNWRVLLYFKHQHGRYYVTSNNYSQLLIHIRKHWLISNHKIGECYDKDMKHPYNNYAVFIITSLR